ncbi:hypothetical protein [Devosia ginsengisoli]|uniref:Uncharacterized protein n=1 Tax=Devosia ginsengisoli TaxID=400770 RepID=A0A5B8LP71_9HYPH|nr:hypothetical protein [Devosia ginsengisoli]QDZ09896.1 hypothetical protein FPZ08_03540 [Devosia ginsengisoli]
MSTSSKREAEAILARFPGPVLLHFNRRRILIMLAVYLGALALMIWLLSSDYARVRGYMSGGKDMMLVIISLLFWGMLAMRAILMLVFPDAASLKLHAEGFEIGHVFHRIRLSWQEVSEFALMKRSLLPFRYGGRVEQVLYENPGAVDKQGKPQAPQVLPDLYGNPRLSRQELVRLLNEWRRRALAEKAASSPYPDRPSASRVPATGKARR